MKESERNSKKAQDWQCDTYTMTEKSRTKIKLELTYFSPLWCVAIKIYFFVKYSMRVAEHFLRDMNKKILLYKI